MSKTRATTGLEQLRAQLPDELVVVDVGCRWGFAPHWESLGSHVKLVGLDADEAEVARLRAEFAGRENKHFVARALGSRPGRARFIHRAEEAQSSLFETAWSRLTHLPEYESGRVVRESQVELSTLDDWTAEWGVERVDALKLDTQGSELDILRGANTCLANVRHVEVEVMFNPLFEGGPLFSEVDAFLRDRGYVLWRFRDLVSHALREAPKPPPVTEQLWYEGTTQPIRVPGGQHMWCNAHFVREDMYAPDSRLGWRTRLRDVCLTDVLEFHDLAFVSLARLVSEPDCPDAVRSAAARVSAERETNVVDPQTPESAAQPATLSHLVRSLRSRVRRS